MTTEKLYQELNYVNHSREKRQYYANLLIINPNLIKSALDILLKVDDKLSPKAAWILEFSCKENLNAFLPYLNYFTNHMHTVYLDAAVRPVAKICEYLTLAYYSNTPNQTQKKLTQIHKEKITALCFDYLITNQKVAPKAYAMQTLFLLGTEIKWIHPELKQILTQDFHLHSAAFKARARHILKKLS